MKKAIATEVLSVVRPSKAQVQEEMAFTEKLISHIKLFVPRDCDVILAGSMAKRTFLQDKKDIDIFVLFDLSIPKTSFETAIKKIMGAAFPQVNYQLSYAEHPYVRFHLEGRRIDLVPAYKISDSSERLSAVDRSVLHTKFVLKELKPKMIDEVLLLKAFLRANSLYGAEIKTQGLSGYLCELLIIRYGSFTRLAKAAAKWEPPVFIDLEKYYKDKASIKNALERLGFFVVIDPTDKKRNVSAAVSKENFQKFISLCRTFLKKPASGFFLKKPETFDDRLSRLSRQKTKLFTIAMPRPDIVDDVLWGQLNRMMGQLEAHMAEFEPKAILADDSWNIVRVALALGKNRLAPETTIEGPPLEMKKHVESFKKSHKKAKFVKRKKRIYAVVKRPAQKAEDAIADFFRKFNKTKSHLACAEELVVLEKIRA